MNDYILSMSNKKALPLLAENIKKYRTALAISQAQLGVKLGYSQQIIFAYESGQRVPPPATLAKMADIFKTSIDILIGKRSTKKQPLEDTKIIKKLRVVEKLPLTAQKNVVALVEDLARAHNITR